MKTSKTLFNILISGTSGYIGSHLINALNDLGDHFYLIDRTFKKERITINRNFIVRERDLTELNAKEIPSQIDILIHNAYCKNLNGERFFLNNFQHKNPHAKIVFFSSAAVYGDLITSNLEKFTISSEPKPINDYGRYKLAIEEYIKSLNSNYQILRISNPYGKEFDQRGVYQIFKNKITETIKLNKHNIEIAINYPKPYTMQRDMIPIDQAVIDIKNIISNQDRGVFNIASGQGIFLEDLAEQILKAFCFEKGLDSKKYKIDFKYNPAREGEIVKSILSV